MQSLVRRCEADAVGRVTEDRPEVCLPGILRGRRGRSDEPQTGFVESEHGGHHRQGGAPARAFASEQPGKGATLDTQGPMQQRRYLLHVRVARLKIERVENSGS